MFALLKRNLFIIVIFILTISLGFLTFLTFINKSFIKLNEENLEILLISNIVMVLIFFVLIFFDIKNSTHVGCSFGTSDIGKGRTSLF
mgnify:CR=1 FL=1